MEKQTRLHMNSLLFWIAAAIASVLALFGLWQMEFSAGRGGVLNYASLRVGFSGVLGLALVGSAAAIYWLRRSPTGSQRLETRMHRFLLAPSTGWDETQPRLFLVQTGLVLLAVFMLQCFLLTYMGFPEPARPLFLWASGLSTLAWALLRRAYADVYQAHPSLCEKLRRKWRGWLPVQRKTFLALAFLGLVNFVVFIPANLQTDDEGRLVMYKDEAVIYPDVARFWVPQADFQQTIYNTMKDWPWWYGYPYLPISASVLLLPRMVYGPDYPDQVVVNVFLMRQFISVLPMVVSLWFLVYLAAGYKNLLHSAALYLFLACVPAVARYNFQFWHPDSIILFLTLLTIYFLRKDNLAFQKYFYFAAAACGFAANLKVFGLFFFLTIGGYLLAGLVQKALTLRRSVLAGGLFILTMAGTIIITTPQFMIPYMTRSFIADWAVQGERFASGYEGVGLTGEYVPGPRSYLEMSDEWFIHRSILFVALATMVAGSLWGRRQYENRLVLGWVVVSLGYLMFFNALKNFQYQIPVLLPLMLSLFWLPRLAEGERRPAFLQHPRAAQALWVLTIALLVFQFGLHIATFLRGGVFGPFI